jgi:hypothetical protein
MGTARSLTISQGAPPSASGHRRPRAEIREDQWTLPRPRKVYRRRRASLPLSRRGGRIRFSLFGKIHSGASGTQAMTNVKDAVLELLRDLPDECTWDDVMERIYVRQKIDAGLRDADEGRTTPHDLVFEEFRDDADPVD